jgi:hypothetical protein
MRKPRSVLALDLIEMIAERLFKISVTFGKVLDSHVHTGMNSVLAQGRHPFHDIPDAVLAGQR